MVHQAGGRAGRQTEPSAVDVGDARLRQSALLNLVATILPDRWIAACSQVLTGEGKHRQNFMPDVGTVRWIAQGRDEDTASRLVMLALVPDLGRYRPDIHSIDAACNNGAILTLLSTMANQINSNGVDTKTRRDCSREEP